MTSARNAVAGVGSCRAPSSNGGDSRRPHLETLDQTARALASDAGAFERIVELTGRGLVRYAARLLGSVADAEDAVQESYVKAHRALLSGRFDGRSSLKTWLYRIVTHTAIDLSRSRRRHASWDDEGLEAALDGAAQAESRVALRELGEWLEGLPAEQYSALVLQAMEGFSNREIADILECSEGAVEQRLVRARASLRAVERSAEGSRRDHEGPG